MSQQVKVYRTLDFYKSSGSTKIASFNCVDSSTILYFRPETDDTGALYFGDGTKDMDVRFTLGSAAVYAEFNVGDAQLKLEGVDITTNSTLTFTGTQSVIAGTSGTPIVLTAGTPIFSLYSTNDSTSGSTSAESFLVYNTQTGIGGVGGRARFYMTTNVALAGWSNALKAQVVYGTSGKTTGLGSSFCAEMTLSAGTTEGNYAPLEAEIIADSAVSTGTASAFLYCNLAGSDATGKTTVNTNGYFAIIDTGIVDTANGMLDAITSDSTPVFEYRLRVKFAGTNMYIPISTSPTFAG